MQVYTMRHGPKNVKLQHYMFRTDLLSFIKSLDTLFTATGIRHTSHVDCLLATVSITSVTNNNRCEYSIKIPDDGQ